MNFNTANSTFRQLMGNGLSYRVPPFQRDYSWGPDEWEDLWQDLQSLFNEQPEPAHYMGYLVLQTHNSKQYDVIDGQQRITTLSVMLLASIACLQDLAETPDAAADPQNQRATQLRNQYVGYLDPVSLMPQSKLSLNRHNDNFYQNYLVPLQKLPQRGLNTSEHLLRRSFLWFRERLTQQAQGDGQQLAQFIDDVVDKLFFTVITVTDELNAFRVFETLNARGVRLSSTDLLKNYLFSVIHNEGMHDKDLTHLEQRWENVVGLLGNESFPEFLRVYWNSRHPLVRKADLFKTIRRSINTRAAAFDLVRQLDHYARIYTALRNPTDEQWQATERDALAQLQMFNVRQPLAVLLAAYDSYFEQNRRQFQRFLHAIVVVSFRYNVIGNRQANEQETVYNHVARTLSAGNSIAISKAILALRPIYPSDADFRAAFADKQLRTSNSRNLKVVRYILFKLEQLLSETSHDADSGRYNVEHVLPLNPREEQWQAFDLQQHERSAYRLGNMTLLNVASNREVGNAEYPVKRQCYQASEFVISQTIAVEYTEWTAVTIAKRQQHLARQACTIWKISFVDEVLQPS